MRFYRSRTLTRALADKLEELVLVVLLPCCLLTAVCAPSRFALVRVGLGDRVLIIVGLPRQVLVRHAGGKAHRPVLARVERARRAHEHAGVDGVIVLTLAWTLGVIGPTLFTMMWSWRWSRRHDHARAEGGSIQADRLAAELAEPPSRACPR